MVVWSLSHLSLSLNRFQQKLKSTISFSLDALENTVGERVRMDWSPLLGHSKNEEPGRSSTGESSMVGEWGLAVPVAYLLKKNVAFPRRKKIA